MKHLPYRSDSDFRAAVAVEVDRFHFAQIIEREFGQAAGGFATSCPSGLPSNENAPTVQGRGVIRRDR